MRTLGALGAALLLGPASALRRQSPPDATDRLQPLSKQHDVAMEQARTATGAWAKLGNYSSLAKMKVGNVLPILQGCSGFDCVEKYCGFNDWAFSWGVRNDPDVGSTNGLGWKRISITMSSQAWLVEQTGKNAWFHIVTVVVPDSYDPNGPNADLAVVFIERALTDWAALEMATRNRVITVAISDVPNQDLAFPAESKTHLDEEDLKALSWYKFARDASHPEWPIEMPNVKAVVRGMDAVTAFTEKSGGLLGIKKVNRFFVAGHSKRAISAYMAGAVDKRVEAIIPVTIALNLYQEGLNAAQDIGGISEYAVPYRTQGVMNLTKDEMLRLFSIVDPVNYLSRLTMPKLAIFAGNDQFFEPDVMRSWWGSVPKPKSLYVFGNTGHLGLEQFFNHENHFFDTADAYVSWLTSGRPMPEIDWSIDEGTGAINAEQVSNHTPSMVTMWRAVSVDDERRDFRGAKWEPMVLQPDPAGDGSTYKAELKKVVPWTGFFVEFEYPALRADGVPLRLTTEVSVMPNTRPFPDANSEDPKWQKVIIPEFPN